MARDYVRHLTSLFPRGAAWNFSGQFLAESVMYRLAKAVAAEFARIDARAKDLLAEMDPRQTTELIDDWERVCGLPDPCGEAPSTLSDRRAAITARLVGRGDISPSAASLLSMIVDLGYDEADVTIRRFHIDAFTCESECDDALNTETAGWPFVWEFVIKSGSVDATVQCEVSAAALAHLGLTFAFPLVVFGDGTFTRASTAVFTDPADGSQSNLATGVLGTTYFGV